MSARPLQVGPSTARGLMCGVGAALCWAFGFVAARHGITDGMSPLAIGLHRFVWGGLVLLPLAAQRGFADLRVVGWRRGAVLTLVGGLPQAVLSYAGFLFVPLGHGGVIQPACASLCGLALASAVIREPLPLRRIAGALAIVLGLCVIGAEALRTMGAHGLIGDLMFAAAGCSFATFGMLLRLWRIDAMPAVAVTAIFSLAGLPLLLFSLDNALRAGFAENLLQALVQGIFVGPVAVYLFTRSVVLLGVSRAAVFPSLVPPFTLLVGFLALGEAPSISQLAGLVIVIVGFRLTQMG
jgi:drug/metabolite transporter (DMT)-like permease